MSKLFDHLRGSQVVNTPDENESKRIGGVLVLIAAGVAPSGLTPEEYKSCCAAIEAINRVTLNRNVIRVKRHIGIS